ncbi:MAG: dihydropteroate synthase [Chitinophagales bacterium]|nr:dihydropteroate synthase [Chitinophagales bacterium]
MLYQQQTLNCKGRLLSLEQPVIMGILNITPDSFFDGGKYNQESSILAQTEKMLQEGASIIDVGGMSSRPGAEVISVEEELQRVIPVIKSIHHNFPEALISIDTVQSRVAIESITAGAHIVNDISAARIDPQMYSTVAKLGVPYILMHMQGKPNNMQDAPNYDNVVQQVLDFLIQEVGKLRALGVKDILLDPGFGFGKTVEHNYELLKKLSALKITGLPILAGVSRKSMICKVLKVNPDKALNGTTALNMIALQQGASILRVHDVKEARETIRLWQQLESV